MRLARGMFACCGMTIVMLAVTPVLVCDVGRWHACPSYSTHKSAWVLLPVSFGLVVIALDKAVRKAIKTIACCPCTTIKTCFQNVHNL